MRKVFVNIITCGVSYVPLTSIFNIGVEDGIQISLSEVMPLRGDKCII
jgi:hypothetical protein